MDSLSRASEFKEELSRQKVADFDASTPTISFFVTEIVPSPNLRKSESFLDEEDLLTIDIHGVDEKGSTVCVKCHGFHPFFYIRATQTQTEEDAELLEVLVNEKLEEIGEPKIDRIEIVMKHIFNHYSKEESKFLKIYVKTDEQMEEIRDIIEEIYADNKPIDLIEANVNIVKRFMIERDIHGGSWVTVKRNIVPTKFKTTIATYEIDCNYYELAVNNERIDIPPLRIMSIKTMRNKFEMIRAIGCSISKHTGENISKVLFTTEDIVDNDPNVICYSYENEKTMINDFNKFLAFVDPDIIAGFEIKDDIKAITSRKSVNFSRYFGTLASSLSVDEVIEDEQPFIWICTVGRIVYDYLSLAKADYNLSAFSLCSVAREVLGKSVPSLSKESVDSIDGKLMVKVCIQQCSIIEELLEKSLSILNTIEMARVCRVNLSTAAAPGVITKVFSQIYRKCAEHGFVILPKHNEMMSYEGGHVFDPVGTYHEGPVVVLDFQSLYPSVMIANNVCYSTLLKENDEKIDGEIKAPNGARFVPKHVRKGILPEILEEVLKARLIAKSMYNQEIEAARHLADENKAESKEHFDRAKVFECRQKALKIVAVSIYGFTGHPYSLPEIAISEAVTTFGKEALLKASNFFNSNNTDANAKIIYGDTDSLFIEYEGKTIDDAVKAGNIIASAITDQFKDPIKFRMEKVYKPFAIFSKKKYVGYQHTLEGKQIGVDMKGIEAVRKDYCPIVQETLTKAIDKWIINGDEAGAYQIMKDAAIQIIDGSVDPFSMILSKLIGKDGYKSKQAHYEAAKRKSERDGTPMPNVGERVKYMITEKKKGPLHEKAEDPFFVLQNKLPLDTKYYIEKQLGPPLERTVGTASPSLLEKIKELKDLKAPKKKLSAEEIISQRKQIAEECKKCRGFEDNIECASFDCPIVYRKIGMA